MSATEEAGSVRLARGVVFDLFLAHCWSPPPLEESPRDQGAAILQRFTAMDEPVPIEPPPGRVYSTHPSKVSVEEEDGFYILKGPDLNTVFSECVAYELAGRLGIEVPNHGACSVPGVDGLFFCCEELRGRFSVDHWLDAGVCTNPDLLSRTIVLDVLIVNHDRNAGNFIEEPETSDDLGRVRLYAIDFEKSVALRGDHPRFAVNEVPPSDLWPSGELGARCNGFAIPSDLCEAISTFTHGEIMAVLENVLVGLDMPTIPWLRASGDVLAQRADRITGLVEEMWLS